MTNNELIDVLKNKKDEEFIKIIRHFKNRIKQIEKKEKLDAIDKKFKEKGIQCPNCKSYWCVKNGFKNNKQKYLCKDCKSSFDALRNHFLHWSHLSHEQWDWIIWLSLLGQSAYTISQFAKISKTSAWFNRQKFMKSSQLAKTQKPFTKLKGRIEIDETFIKEIHKGNFKNPDDPRKKWIEENAKDLNCCIEMAIDENKNIYAQTTNTKRLTKKWVQENLTSKLIEEKSIIVCDMQILYDTVAKQTKCTLKKFKSKENKELNYKNLSNISKIQSSLKEFITHYHGIGFTNIQNYLNLWKFKYRHYKIYPYAKSEALYFGL
ncbi:IS1595 family transposase [Spiroplasma endosymbiont of Zeiraphera isertana]|uniref:IS1595 family transposase n=1 Tax=Spiroplasma endosymbiont of Zeiraphera isertana TaxID=3066313 RepID=UPI00313E9646